MNPPPSRVLHVLTGCTAVGKTELALRWAEQNNAEIISCDSLLFYRGMDIGTAKPTREELDRVPHHLVDVCDLSEQMDITRYVSLARAAAEDILGRGRAILVTGGSGFYLKAFYSPVADEVEVDPALRERLRALPPEEALERLRALNPAGLGSLDVQNPRRVTRALERCLASGRSLGDLAEAFSRQLSPFHDWTLRTLRLERDTADLEQRLRLRVRQMLDAGLVGEVRRLEAAGLRLNPSAARAIGYREPLALFDGTLPETELEATIVANTRALVKKQRTWFRTQLPPHTVTHPVDVKVSDLFH